jgi:restriction system protein
LDWSAFEQWVTEAYRRQGYVVQATAGGADGGVDLVLERGGEKTYVQCKHWQQRRVDVRPIRELYGVMTAGKAQRGAIVITGSFTAAARSEAHGKPISLVDGSDLLGLLGSPPDTVAFKATGDTREEPTAAPPCPRCGSPMVVRQAKRGDRPGTMFLGCVRFPECRGTRAMS